MTLNIYIRTLPCRTGFTVHQDRETVHVPVTGRIALIREATDRINAFYDTVVQNREASESVLSAEEVSMLFDHPEYESPVSRWIRRLNSAWVREGL